MRQECMIHIRELKQQPKHKEGDSKDNESGDNKGEKNLNSNPRRRHLSE